MNKIRERRGLREARTGTYARKGMAMKERDKREDRFYVQKRFCENERHAAS